MIKRLLTITLVLALAAALGSCKKKEHQTAEERPGPEIAAKLLVLAPESVGETYAAVGAVVSDTQSSLSARIMGHVQEVLVDEGSRVVAGQPLVILDARDIESQVRQAEAGAGQARSGQIQAQSAVAQAQAGVAQALAARDQASKAIIELDQGIAAAEAGLKMARAQQDLAVKTFRRYEQLNNEQSVSGQEFDQIQSQKKVADAVVEQAEKTIQSMRAKRPQIDAQIRQADEVVTQARQSVEQARQGVEQARDGVTQADQGVAQTKIMRGYAIVSAPFDGVIVKRLVEPGQLAAPGAPLLVIEDDAQFRLEVSVDESRVGDIAIGDEVRVKIDALNRELDGIVHDITPSADAVSRSFKVKIALPNAAQLRSGMYGRALFRTGSLKKIMIPRAAVVAKGGVDGVYVVDKKKRARFRVIRRGDYGDDNRAEVFSGLSTGETIVADARGMADGARVRER